MSAVDPPCDTHDKATAYRILDANLNRCTEGLRVIEEFLRFGREDAHLSAICKQLRHDLVALAVPLSARRLHAMRDVPGDVGAGIATESEYRRVDLEEVAVANLKRVTQSLRSMEEYAKVVSQKLAADFESLRYQVYTLERAITVLGASLERLGSARLYVLVNGCGSQEAFCTLVVALLDSGVNLLQLRDKQLSDRALLERAAALRQLTRQGQVLFIMNDRVDVAMAAGADGVHLGQEELPVREARRLLGPDALIGVSTRCIEQARQAVVDGANYIGCGPTFPSATKSFPQFPGLPYLRQVSREITLPAFAIGGIHHENLGDVLRTGVRRVAVSHSVVQMPDPAQAARQLADQLRAAERGTT